MPNLSCIIGKVRIWFAKENLSHRRQPKNLCLQSSLLRILRQLYAWLRVGSPFPCCAFLGCEGDGVDTTKENAAESISK